VAETLVFDVPGPLQSVTVVAPPASAAAQGAAGGAGGAAGAPGPAAAPTVEDEQARRGEEQRKGLEQTRAALESAVKAVQALEAEIVSGTESQLVALALEIAGKILVQTIEDGKYRIEPIVREALRRIPSRCNIVVRLNPQDLARWQEAAATVPVVGLKLTADPGVRKAECVVECAEAVVSATVAEGLARAAEAMKKQD
jgi:flagellar biosynthesis/type III secretory pathway protein FliH